MNPNDNQSGSQDDPSSLKPTEGSSAKGAFSDQNPTGSPQEKHYKLWAMFIGLMLLGFVLMFVILQLVD